MSYTIECAYVSLCVLHSDQVLFAVCFHCRETDPRDALAAEQAAALEALDEALQEQTAYESEPEGDEPSDLSDDDDDTAEPEESPFPEQVKLAWRPTGGIL